MQIRREYDLIVVGDQLAGFFLAAGAAQAGLKVLIVEGSTVPTALFEVPSGRFLTDLVCEPLLGLAAGSKEEKFLQSLGLFQDSTEIFPHFLPALQVITPKWRVDYNYEPQELQQEFTRELGKNATNLVRVLSGQSVSKKRFDEVLAQEKLPVAWEQFGALQLALYGSTAPQEIPYSAYKKVVDLASRGGVRYVIGGRSALKERLLSRIHIHQGNLKRNAWVEEIIFERNKLSGVLLSTYEGFIKSPIVVGSMRANTFLELVPPSMRPQKISASVSGIAAKYWRMSFNIIVPENLIPEGLGEHFSFLDPELPLEEDQFFQVQLLPKEAYSGIPSGHRSMLVRFLVPYVERSLKPEFIQRLMRKVILKLETVMPGLRKKALSITPDPENIASDLVYKNYFHFTSLAHIPPAFLVYHHTLDEDLTGNMFMDWSAFGLDGLALCSRDMDPLLGLMGEIRTAMALLDGLLARRMKLKKV